MILVALPMTVDRLLSVWLWHRWGGLADTEVMGWLGGDDTSMLDTALSLVAIGIPNVRTGPSVIEGDDTVYQVWQLIRTELDSQHAYLGPMLSWMHQQTADTLGVKEQIRMIDHLIQSSTHGVIDITDPVLMAEDALDILDLQWRSVRQVTYAAAKTA